jgi:hypothetical protein
MVHIVTAIDVLALECQVGRQACLFWIEKRANETLHFSRIPLGI